MVVVSQVIHLFPTQVSTVSLAIVNHFFFFLSIKSVYIIIVVVVVKGLLVDVGDGCKIHCENP